jgi:hypothetical protein
MKITPDLPALDNTQRASQLERSQSADDAAKTQGVNAGTVTPPLDILQLNVAVAKIEGAPIDLGAPPPAPAVPPSDPAPAAGVYSDNVGAAVDAAGDTPFSNPTADNLARAFLAQQILSDRQDTEAEEELLTVSTNLTQLAIENTKKEIARLQAQLAEAEAAQKSGGGFPGSMMMFIDPIGTLLMQQLLKPSTEKKTDEIEQKLDAAHKRLDTLVDGLAALTKHLRQLQDSRIQENVLQLAQETAALGTDGVPRGTKEKLRAALADGLAALAGQPNVTADDAVAQLTDRACAVLSAAGIPVDAAVRVQVAQRIREDLFGEPSATAAAVKAGVAVVADFSRTAATPAPASRILIR